MTSRASGTMAMDSMQDGPRGLGGAARKALLPALALATVAFLAAHASVRAADSADASTSGAVTSAGAAAAPADGARGQPVAGALGQPAAGAPSAAADDEAGEAPLTRVRVAILNATGKPGGANKVALLLSEVKRRALENQIGLQIEVVNLSTAEGVPRGQSVLYYRPVFLRAALAMARAIPSEVLVRPMRPDGLKRAGVDVEIVMNEDLP